MKIFLALCLCSIVIGVNAQSFTVSADRMDVAYIGMSNPLTIVADNATCKELIATTDNGTIVKKDSCRFYFSPERESKSIITIQKKINGKNITIGTKELRVKRIPDPHVMVAHKSSGPISLSIFKKQQGVDVGYDSDDRSDFGFSIVSFTIAFIYNPCGDHLEDIVGSKFTAQTTPYFRKLKVGDRVVIENIKVKGPDNIIRKMNEMVFVMRQ